jgi:hypothetical protein
MTEMLFIGGVFLGSGLIWLAAVVIDARECRKRAEMLGHALTSGADVDVEQHIEQDHG